MDAQGEGAPKASSGRRIWVAGAGRGIGAALAARLRTEGFEVSAFSRRWGQDFSDPSCVEALLQEHGPPWGWIHCPGSFLEKPLLETGIEEWEELLRSNLHSFLVAAKVLLPAMAEEGGGRVLVFGASGLDNGMARRRGAAYFAVKAALLECLRSLAFAFAPKGICMHMVCPGLILHEHSARESQERLAPRVPAGRLGTPADLFGLCTYLLSEESAYQTGSVLSVDGGLGLGPITD